MIQRIFQHYEGMVASFSHIEFSTAKAVVDSTDNNVIVVWLQDKKNRFWYRIFIDGVYCGIDQLTSDNSFEDLDEDTLMIDYSDWFKNKKIINAKVRAADSLSSDIIFSMKFEKSECQLIYRSRQHTCELAFCKL